MKIESSRPPRAWINLVLLLAGIAAIWWTWTSLSFASNFFLTPLLLWHILSMVSQFRAARRSIVSLEFEEDGLALVQANKKQRKIPYNQLGYALLTKKFLQPFRNIELRQNVGKRWKPIGRINHQNWLEIKQVVVGLVSRDLERFKWKYGVLGWQLFFLMIDLLFGGLRFASLLSGSGSMSFQDTDTIGDAVIAERKRLEVQAEGQSKRRINEIQSQQE